MTEMVKDQPGIKTQALHWSPTSPAQFSNGQAEGRPTFCCRRRSQEEWVVVLSILFSAIAASLTSKNERDVGREKSGRFAIVRGLIRDTDSHLTAKWARNVGPESRERLGGSVLIGEVSFDINWSEDFWGRYHRARGRQSPRTKEIILKKSRPTWTLTALELCSY